MKKALLFLLCLCVGVLPSFAQDDNLTVTGRVVDEAGAKLVGAHVRFSSMDETPKMTDVVVDTAGYFEVKLPLNYYTMRVTFTGFAPYEARVECLGNMDLPPIVMRESSSELAGVEVTAKRISYNARGYVANIANDQLFKGVTLVDAMRMLPGLYLKDGEFQAYGENIGSVFVNNKRLMYTGSALVGYLRTLQAKNIVSVQVLNSTADPLLTDKMAFVLKITTKRYEDGGNATVGASAKASNVYDFQAKPTLNIQQRIGKWSMFLLPDYTPRSVLNRGMKNTTHLYESDEVRKETQMTHLKFKPTLWLTGGLSYEIDKNNNVSLNVSGMHQKRSQTAETRNDVFGNSLQTGTTTGYVGERRKINQFEGMVNYYGELPIATLYGSLNYAFKEDDGHTNRDQTLAKGQQNLFRQDKMAYYHLFSGSLSGTWKLAKAHQLITSASVTSWDNKSHYCLPLVDGANAYRYLYKESSFDGSLGYEYSKGVWDVNVGTRYLNSRMKPVVEQGGVSSSYTRDVSKLLPFATITYIYDPESYKTLTLQYERSYDFSNLIAMDPSNAWRSEYSYDKGNPNLAPGFTDEIALQTRVGGFSLRSKYVNTLATSRIYQLDDNKNEVISYDNGLHHQYIFLYVGFPMLQLSDKWRVNYHCTYKWSKESYGGERRVASQVTGGFLSMATLPGDISLHCSAELNSPQRSLYSDLYYIGNIDGSLGKWFLKNRLYVGLNCSYTFLTRSRTMTQQFRYDSRFDRSMFMATLSASYQLKWGNKRARVNANRVVSIESMRMN